MPSSSPILSNASAVITGLDPSIDGGRHAVKRILGETLVVQADIFKDGHDMMDAALLWRRAGDETWREVPMTKGENDRWQGEVGFHELGDFEFTVAAWPDLMGTWKRDFRKKVEAGLESLELEIQEGALLVKGAALRARLAGKLGPAREMMQMGELMVDMDAAEVLELIHAPEVEAVLASWPDRFLMTLYQPIHRVIVEPLSARFSAWYEFFPRNAKNDGMTHATLRECRSYLEHASRLGFDVVYVPPIHPIGISNRKGKNNSTICQPGEVGSPWAIGGPAGGHTAVEPALGTLEDFDFFLNEARSLGLEVALDFALQCSPDHPWVQEHPEWFHIRPDGSIKYAENPPKKYQDIYPLNFHGPDWPEMWAAMRDVLLFWCARGVKIFRVDNPHTKPVAFWEYTLGEVRKRYPGTIFLAEAFTVPKMMAELAKIGYSQSYSYFTWRLTKHDLMEYVTELTQTQAKEYMRANFWPNTPDILAFELWDAPPQKFKVRATLAATMMPSWGIYSGYEFCENAPFPPKEEYLDSEKYQLRARDLGAPGITAYIRALNTARRENAAFEGYDNIQFVSLPNDQLIAYVKVSEDRTNRILVIVNLDVNNTQSGSVGLPGDLLGLAEGQTYQVRDLLTGESWTWRGLHNYVELAPATRVAHVFRIES